jgi:hypothetical protein
MKSHLDGSVAAQGESRPVPARALRGSVLLAVSGVIALLAACSASEPESPAIRVTLTPAAASVHLMLSVQFTATVHNATNGAVAWSLSGSGCSGASCGTISDTGLYTAPVILPDPATVTVKATSAADPAKSASATITILEGVNAWTWISGSDTVNEQGVYGTKGVPSTANVPRSRDSAVSWIDPQGKFWLFGGNAPGYLNDLWTFDPGNFTWTWISGKELTPSSPSSEYGSYGTRGVPAASNVPGARLSAVSWADPQGDLWLFGGYGYASPGYLGGFLNDLWKFDRATREWTWMSGGDLADEPGVYGTKGTPDPSAVPGARASAVSWTDTDGRLWLFGGNCYASGGDIGVLSDLWRFDPETLEWTWMSGGDQLGLPAVYGTKGVASSANSPGARYMAVSWIDAQNTLWLFGGTGFDSSGNIDLYGDLWNYDPLTAEWTWVSGTNVPNQPGHFGVMGTPDAANEPGAKGYAVSWCDSQGKLWLFGGNSFDGCINDLWKFDPATLQWTWISGSGVVFGPARYGTRGTIDALNVPGPRACAVSWIDAQDRLWLFGGRGYVETGIEGRLNDLWRYIQ